jgi:membrane protein implicated in regulation of membrane protease activity
MKSEKWYFKTSTLIIALLCIGPFALPLLWLNRRFSLKVKIIISVFVIILSYYLVVWFLNTLKTVKGNYQEILQLFGSR